MLFPEPFDKANKTCTRHETLCEQKMPRLIRFAGLRDREKRLDVYNSMEWRACMLDILLACISGEALEIICKREDVSISTVLRWFIKRPAWVLPLANALSRRKEDFE